MFSHPTRAAYPHGPREEQLNPPMRNWLPLTVSTRNTDLLFRLIFLIACVGGCCIRGVWNLSYGLEGQFYWSVSPACSCSSPPLVLHCTQLGLLALHQQI